MNELIFNEALDYMSFDEWLDLCTRIYECYNKIKKPNEEENNNGCN